MLNKEKKEHIEDLLQEKEDHDRVHVFVLYDIPPTIKVSAYSRQEAQEGKKEYMEREIEPWYKQRSIADYQMIISLCEVDVFLTKEQIKELLTDQKVTNIMFPKR